MTRHTVVRGDSLWRLGQRYGVAWRDIAAANGVTTPYVLTVGQVLAIPVPAPASSDPPLEAELVVVAKADGYTEHRWRRYEPVRWIIVHDPVGGSPAGTISYLRHNDRQVSYNELLVPGDGPTSHVLAPPEWYVGHSGYGQAPDGTRGPALNRASWGLCIYKGASDEGAFPVAMERAAVRLAAVRCRQFGIGADRVLAHREVDPKRRRDPRGFDMDAFRASIARMLRQQV